MNSGIYKITNIINNKFYIGSTVNFKNRLKEHKNRLKSLTHANSHLQSSVNKYKIENFKFEILYTCPKEYLIKLEQKCIDSLKPQYNIRKVADSNLGIKMKKHSEESKLKRSESMKGNVISQETKDKIRNTLLGRKRSKESIDKFTLSIKGKTLGRKFSDEHKRKLSEFRKTQVGKIRGKYKVK